MAQETPGTPIEGKEGQGQVVRRGYLWSRSTNGPVGEGTPEPGTRKLDPKEFHENFPAGGKKPEQLQGGIPSISEAVSTIKTEDFFTVSQTPCARNGFMTGIAAGAGLGGLKFVFRGSPLKAANWAVGGFLMGSIAGFELCQYARRQERVNMMRAVEVYQETMAEKRVREEAAMEQKKLEEEALKASQRAWYKFW